MQGLFAKWRVSSFSTLDGCVNLYLSGWMGRGFGTSWTSRDKLDKLGQAGTSWTSRGQAGTSWTSRDKWDKSGQVGTSGTS